MALLTVSLFLIFGQYRTGATTGYSAVFTDVSRLKAGIRCGSPASGWAPLRCLAAADNTVLVTFDADRNVVLTNGTKAAVRYLNLVGDRYLELVDGPGSTKVLPRGHRSRRSHRARPGPGSAAGWPETRYPGPEPARLNALTASLMQIFQGQGGTLDRCCPRRRRSPNTLADNSQTVQQLIDNLKPWSATLPKTATISPAPSTGSSDSSTRTGRRPRPDRRRHRVAGQRHRVAGGPADQARPPLAGTVDQLNRLAPLLDEDKDRSTSRCRGCRTTTASSPALGAYGSFFPYYLCGLSFRVTDLQGRTVVFPWVKQEDGRCAEP